MGFSAYWLQSREVSLSICRRAMVSSGLRTASRARSHTLPCSDTELSKERPEMIFVGAPASLRGPIDRPADLAGARGPDWPLRFVERNAVRMPIEATVRNQ